MIQKKIIALQDTSDVYFFNFAINLLTRIPDVPTDSSTNGTNVYIDANGDLVIETKDNASDERIQIEIIYLLSLCFDYVFIDTSYTTTTHGVNLSSQQPNDRYLICKNLRFENLLEFHLFCIIFFILIILKKTLIHSVYVAINWN